MSELPSLSAMRDAVTMNCRPVFSGINIDIHAAKGLEP